MNATPESLIKDYADPIEQQEIDKFVCSEMGRQIHRYIKGMSGTKQAMLKFEERLASLSVPEKEKAIAKYIDLNRKALDGLDLKMILVRSVANYCDTFQYMLDFVNDKRKMVFYYQRIKAKYSTREESAMFEAVMAGVAVHEAVARFNQEMREQEDDIEFF